MTEDQPPAPRGNWVVTVEFTVASGFADPFMERLALQASESLREVGCWRFDVCVDPFDEHHVFLYELYSDREAFATHLASSHFKDFDAATRLWIESKRVTEWRRSD
jgi:autoinducer 2-degrading protein